MTSRSAVLPLLLALALASCDEPNPLGVPDLVPEFSHVGGVMVDQQQLVAAHAIGRPDRQARRTGPAGASRP